MILDCRVVTVDGQAYLVKVVPDDDATPTGEDWRTAADLQAWQAGQWRYVGLIVEHANDSARSESVWSVVFGQCAGTVIDMDYLISEDYYVPSMIREIGR